MREKESISTLLESIPTQRNQLINKGIHFWAKISHKESTPIWEESIPNGYQQILKLRLEKSFSDYLFIKISHPMGLIKSFPLYKKVTIDLVIPTTTSVWDRTASTRSISHTTHSTSKNILSQLAKIVCVGSSLVELSPGCQSRLILPVIWSSAVASSPSWNQLSIETPPFSNHVCNLSFQHVNSIGHLAYPLQPAHWSLTSTSPHKIDQACWTKCYNKK